MLNSYAYIDNGLSQNTKWDTAIYVRISEEEKKKSISDSIENQKEILSDYAKVHQLNVYKVYEDDGVRGGTFDRPSFKRMISDIESGYVNCVLVKDLSRFGREHIDTDHYLERYFPQRGVRFISVIQGLDSVADPHRMNSIEVPMLNIFNEQYLRQVSNSTKASLMIKRKEGKFVGTRVPYGYKRDEKDKYLLVVEPETYTNVQDIYKWFLDYNSLSQIAKRLNDKDVLSPAAFTAMKKGKTSRHTRWTHMIVRGILNQEIYTGDMVQGKTYSYNCKVNKREPLPREKWDIVPNTHEAIIDKNDFAKVQQLLSKKSKPKKTVNNTLPSILAGFLVCKECGKKMIRNTSYYVNESGEKVSYNRFVCSTYKHLGKRSCSSHMVREDTILEILSDVISMTIDNVVDASKIIKKADKAKLSKQIGIHKNRLYSVNQTIEKLKNRIAGLYSDYKDEILTLEEYHDMKERFSKDKDELVNEVQRIETQICELESSGDTFIEPVQKYIQFKDYFSLDRNVLSTLVDGIIIDKEKNITVNFKFKDEIKDYCNILF